MKKSEKDPWNLSDSSVSTAAGSSSTAATKSVAFHEKRLQEAKLDKIYDVLNHIRWIGLSIAMMFAMTFVIPQSCS